MNRIRNFWKSGNGYLVKTGVLTVLVFFVLLTGCSPSTPVAIEPIATEKPVETTLSTATAVPTEILETATPTQTQFPTPAESLSAEDQALIDINGRWDNYVQANQLLNQLIQDMAANPNLMTDDGWRREVGFVLNALDLAANDLETLSDSPPEYVQLEENFHVLASETYLFIDNFSYAIANLDSDTMSLAIQNVRTMSEFTHQIEAELESYSPE